MKQEIISKNTVLEVISNTIKEEVTDLESATSGFYNVIRQGSSSLSRYVIKFRQDVGGFCGYLYDHKTGKNTKLLFDTLPETITISTTKSIKPKIDNKFKLRWEAFSEFKDNGYLKAHKLYGKYPHLKYDNGDIKVKYVPVDLPDIVAGIKSYNTSSKLCEKGSIMKGSVCFHKTGIKNDTCYVVEGLADGITILDLLPNENEDTTIVETGGVGNLRNVIAYLSKTYKTVILVGENDSIAQYSSYRKDNIQVVFPPQCKDISDFYQECGENETKKVLFEPSEVPQSYKPLGFLGKNLVLYSKKIKSVQEYPLSNHHELLNLGMGINGVLTMTKEVKSRLVDLVVEQCSKIGQYTTLNEKSVGLHAWKDKYYFNTGKQVYDLKANQFKSYGEVVRDKFLLNTRQSDLNVSLDDTYDIEGLLELFRQCNWEYEYYADVFLGFLVQSVYAGASEFSPHLWFKSNKPKSGKSWLLDWTRTTLFPDSPSCDGAGTTSKGFRQSMRFYSGLSFIDEFAEEDNYNQEASSIITTLRSASTGKSPVTLGQKNQVPIQLYLKFSSLLACVKGLNILLPQDYERIIFLNLKRKENTYFDRTIKPLFMNWTQTHRPEGFLMECLRGFGSFNDDAHRFQLQIDDKLSGLGHKSRGLGSVLAGYKAITKCERKTQELFNHIMTSPLAKPLKDSYYEAEVYNDLMDTNVPRDVTGKTTLPLHYCVSIGLLSKYGIIKEVIEGSPRVLIDVVRFKPLLDRVHKGVNLGIYTENLKTSKHFIGEKRLQKNKNRVRYLMFEWLTKYNLEEEE